MSPAPFRLDPRLARDTLELGQLALCQLLLMNDSRYPWLILVPRRAELREVLDLDPDGQAALWQEAHQAAAALQRVAGGGKLNLATLGNVVSQLHIHVVIRNEGDPAWPDPVWGRGRPVPYAPAAAQALRRQLRQQLGLQDQ